MKRKKNLEKNEQKQKDNNKQTPGIGKITVGYGDVGSYYGKGKAVIKNVVSTSLPDPD